MLHAHERRRLLRELPRVGDHQGHRLAVVLRLAHGQDGPVLVLRARSAGTGCGRSSAVITRCTPGSASAADASTETIRARAQSSVTSFAWSGVRHAEVRDVLLGAGDAPDATDAGR